MDYSKKILNVLMDKYESSKSFIGSNQVKQRFSASPDSLVNKYKDHSDYHTFEAVNEAIKELETLGFITVENNGPAYTKVFLETERLEQIYSYLLRRPKTEMNTEIHSILEEYSASSNILSLYCLEQIERLKNNKKVKGFKDTTQDLKDVLEGVKQLLLLTNETFERDFSVRIYGDSKRFKKLENRIISILDEFGDYPDKESILGELNLIKNLTYVYIKGSAVLYISDQRIDLEKIPGGIALPSSALDSIDKIEVTGNRIVSIENLTSYHTFNEKGSMNIYLGGFHNNVRRRFLKKVYNVNPAKTYLHFGDIDIGGFLILEHLKMKTGIDFEAYRMGIHELEKYSGFTRPLTENDIKRAVIFKETKYWTIISYMLEHNVKLEQEALD